MPIRRNKFIQRYPRLYHVSLASSLDQVHQHGLLSATALLDRFEITGAHRERLERRPRAQRELLTHAQHGSVFLNDQTPLSEMALSRCLIDMIAAEWCRNLNGRVFFSPTLKRLDSLFHAKLSRTYDRIVLSADTEQFLDVYANRIEWSPINSGNTRRKAAKRGRQTFQPLDTFFHRHGAKSTAVAEITIPYEVQRTDLFTLYQPTSTL